MTPSEVAKLLTLAAAYDRRTLGPTDVAAWHSIVNDLRFTEAESALKAHYAETERFVMPSDIRRIAGTQRREAIERRRSAELAIENRERRQTPDGRHYLLFWTVTPDGIRMRNGVITVAVHRMRRARPVITSGFFAGTAPRKRARSGLDLHHSRNRAPL